MIKKIFSLIKRGVAAAVLTMLAILTFWFAMLMLVIGLAFGIITLPVRLVLRRNRNWKENVCCLPCC